MDYVIIKDDRKKFKKTTFSNYKKSEVIKKLVLSLYYQKVEESFFWTCELICTNLILDLWNIYFLLMSKHIHSSNPKLPILIYKKYTEFKELMNTIPNELDIRNNKQMRFLFCTLTLIICLSDKHSIR